MGYRGKLEQRQRARELRAEGWTMPDIAVELGVSRSSVSLWTRDVEVQMGPRRMRGAALGVTKQQQRRLAEIEKLDGVGEDATRGFIGRGLSCRRSCAVRR